MDGEEIADGATLEDKAKLNAKQANAAALRIVAFLQKEDLAPGILMYALSQILCGAIEATGKISPAAGLQCALAVISSINSAVATITVRPESAAKPEEVLH